MSMWQTIRERLCHKIQPHICCEHLLCFLKTLEQIKAQKPQFCLSKVSEGEGVRNER